MQQPSPASTSQSWPKSEQVPPSGLPPPHGSQTPLMHEYPGQQSADVEQVLHDGTQVVVAQT